MSQLAHVQNNKVVNIIIANPDVKKMPKPRSGITEVPLADDHQVTIGMNYDGTTFSADAPTKDDLMMHAYARVFDYVEACVTIPDGTRIVVHDQMQDLLQRVADVARTNPAATTTWPQDQHTAIPLTASQVIDLDDGLNAHCAQRLKSYGEVVADIQNGTITEQWQVDDRQTYRWPARGLEETELAP